MGATRKSRASSRRAAAHKRIRRSRAALRRSVKSAVRKLPVAPDFMMFRVCKAGWAVLVEKTPNALGTRFVCPFCPVSHRVPGPVRGFKKMRRAQWIKLRRVSE